MESDEIRNGIEKFMPYSFKLVNEFSDVILEQERRYVYTTPKSFLELIKLFKVMYGKKFGELEQSKETYETGVVKLTETGEVVAKLEEELKIFAVEVEAKKKMADEQAEIVGGEKAKVEVENDKAEVEAVAVGKIKVAVEAEMASVQKDLDAALPLVEKAKKALDGLNVKDFQNLKALKSPPAAIDQTFTCVLHLLSGIDPIVPVDKNGKLKTENTWKEALKCMAKPEAFLETLNGLKAHVDNDTIKASNFNSNKATLADDQFTPEIIMTKSSAAGGLCDFIINITMYYNVVVTVEPKKLAVAKAQAELKAANEKKAIVDELVAKLNADLQVLMDAFKKVMKDKNDAIAEQDRCNRKLDLAQRLVGALGSEQERWSQSIIDIGELIKVIIGDVLMASAFVSYVGPFNKIFRDKILTKFLEFFKVNNVPMSEGCNPLTVLTDEATVAGWNTCGLPPDRVSTENGSILTNSERYSLIIDPQLQGITWLRKTYDSKGLKVTRLSNPKMVKTVEFAVEAGEPVLIENMDNSIDAVIQPVYSRAVVKRGKNKYIKMGDKELQLHPNFNLFLHTKLSNPHYPPEIQAECTLINFTVTEDGLEDQLLSLVVKMERPDLAQTKEQLISDQNGYKIKLKELEKGLLKQLAEAEGDILENIELIESLEFSKKLSGEIQEKVEIAKETEININIASEFYRPAASRGALVFFLMNELYKIHSFYKFSLDSFVIVVQRAINIVAEMMNPKKAKKEVEEGEEDGED
jgi:dynein heavy chain